MTDRELFPLGKAYGKAFCNRVEETAELVGHIQNGKHTLLVAPRRFGKSSLAERAINKSGFPFIEIDFHLCTSQEEIALLVIDQVATLIGKAIGKVDQLANIIKQSVSNLEPFISIGGKTTNLKLIPKDNTNHAVIIFETLMLIEKLLRKKNKKAAIFFDEFQEITHISEHHSIEGAIRKAAQETTHLSFIFSGSIRSLLLSMFEDENRPLYKLCRKIKLERISSNDYIKHIQKIATHTWNSSLPGSSLNLILSLSNRHPYYVNYLCDNIWERCENLPKEMDITSSWQRVISQEWRDALKEISALPLGQKRLLKYIANHHTKSIQSQATSAALSMANSSIATAAHALIEKDYVDVSGEGYYCVIDPLLLSVLKGEINK